MREIEFRGKRKDSGEWVYGYYIETDEREHYIFTGETGLSQASPAHHLMYKDFLRYKVIPETIGEYTGLKDKNGVKIFEGDIVEGSDAGCKNFRRIIFFDDKMAHFGVKWPKAKGEFLLEGLTVYRIDLEDIRIISNIQDTPELLDSEVKR